MIPTIRFPARLTGAALCLVVSTAGAQQPIDIAKLQTEAVQRTREYLRINTTNPPGNEVETMRWFAKIFKQEGIQFDTAVSAPGRGNIWARIKGGNQPALMLLHHMDVVPADPKYWDVDPFAATTKDSVIFGRGALDTKTLGVVELEAFLALHRAKVPLDRDVVFMATADEEAGGNFGAGWVVKNRPEAFKGVGFILNEGGGGDVDEGGRVQFAIEVTQKTPYWIKLTSVGKPGHGSTPAPESAVNRLIRALARLQTYEFAPRVLPAVAAYMAAVAPSMEARWNDGFNNPAKIISDRSTLMELQIEHAAFAALLRNTCSITMLQASNKINVIPPEAQAQVDCRLLPDQDHAVFLREFTAVLNDANIKIDTVVAFSAAVSSTDTPLYKAMTDAIRRSWPSATIAPAVQTGFTDSHWFRDLGIASYGFAPFVIPVAEESGTHGNNERISIENIRKGTAVMLEIVRAVAADKN
ncbi:MAG TPA: M20/M25/M40 family metallo-hydrolase [Gemmatimonadaceae bacterium]|nr:M20/M25/M40 family metallo-hydrolase [Gemmatimonadaceae bacterium]